MRPSLIVLPLLVCAALAGSFCAGRCGLHHAAKPVEPERIGTMRSQPKMAPETKHPPATALPGMDGEESGDELPDIPAIGSYEELMYAQPNLVNRVALRPQTPGKVDLYAVGFAGDSEESVFRNEVEFLPKLLAGRFGAEGRTIRLINSPETFRTTPIATRTNLMHALANVGDTIDRNDDIVLLFLTSHGSRDHHLLVEMGSLPLDQLTAKDIREAFDRAHITWRVIVVSACFSGGFIPELREPHTMIITAAREDRTSFGCGSDSEVTWFGKAFLTEALNRTADFRDAFGQAKKSIASWEKRDKQTPSEPQFWEGPLIEAKLAAWRATLPASATQVKFEPANGPSARGRASR